MLVPLQLVKTGMYIIQGSEMWCKCDVGIRWFIYISSSEMGPRLGIAMATGCCLDWTALETVTHDEPSDSAPNPRACNMEIQGWF